MTIEHNPEIQCEKCGIVFILLGDHEVKPGMRFRCPSIECARILVIKPLEVIKE